MTLPRKMSANCITWPRVSPSAEILNSASSRATASSGSRSRILLTFTSLCSCLVTWSIGWSAPSRVIVMRDSVGSSVGPTASVVMLNPRRANSPATRASTPGLFSTSSVRMCLRPVWMPPAASRSDRLRTSLVPGSPMALPDHVPGSLAGRDHRVAVLLLGHVHVEQHGAGSVQRLAHLLDERALLRRAHAGGAVGLGELHPVRALLVHRGVAAVPEQLLPLTHHPEEEVVHQEDLHWDAVRHGGRKLLRVHLQRAVAGEADNRHVRARDLRTERERKPDAHRAETAAVQPATRLVEVVVLRR